MRRVKCAMEQSNGGGVRVRDATIADVDVAREAMAALGYPQQDAQGFADVFARVLAAPNAWVLIAEDARGQVRGLLAMSQRLQLRLAGPIAAIDELVVFPEARGAGVGRALLAAAQSRASALGARRIELHTQRGRESYARGFYAKQGFREVDSALMRADSGAPTEPGV